MLHVALQAVHKTHREVAQMRAERSTLQSMTLRQCQSVLELQSIYCMWPA
jgi:hypothetical protein